MSYAEQQFREWATAKGWKVSKRGWPDFICEYDGAVVAVEVKGPNDGLMPEQHEVLCALNAIGMPTYVWTPAKGLGAYPMTPVKESLSTLRAEISGLQRIIRDLLAERDAETTRLYRELPKLRPMETDQFTRLAPAELEARIAKGLGPVRNAKRLAWIERHKDDVLDPAVAALRGRTFLDKRA